jgi:HEAT repeat protein
MVRLADGEVQKIRSFSEDCELDAGGLPVYWWSNVDPDESLDFLETQAQQQRSTRMAESALQAIAHHAEPRADDLLEDFAMDRRDDVAEQAIFWLGAVRGEGGLNSLKGLGETIEDIDLLEHLTFALYLSEASGALPELVDMARNDESGDVRGQALFWLSQKAGRQAIAALEEAVEEDPDLEVKKKAVFGLSQLPPDEGVPLLIELAQTHRHPKVRKQAMFWLGQSGDQQALEFFEEVLLR